MKVPRSSAAIAYPLTMAAVIVAVDILFFQGHIWERLAANLAIVVVFVALYLFWGRRP